MNTSQICRFFAAVAACVGLAQAAIAQDSIPAETSVWIFSDRYISSEHVVSSPEPLNARVRSARPRVISLDVCEPFPPHVLLTAYLFRDFHLEIRPRTAEHPACMMQVAARAVTVGGITQAPPPDEDQAVDRYWLSVMP